MRTDRTNRGLSTLAVQAVTEEAFAAGYRRLIIHCDEGNVRSASVARKAGFTLSDVVSLDPDLPRTPAETGREMTWIRDSDFP
jgi:RimJ/RimL family protein N-acetyltransferase